MTGESVFKKSERRCDLEKWYGILVKAILENIPRVAVEHQRTPHEVVKMGECDYYNAEKLFATTCACTLGWVFIGLEHHFTLRFVYMGPLKAMSPTMHHGHGAPLVQMLPQ